MVRIRIPGGVMPTGARPRRRRAWPPGTARTGCTSRRARTWSCTGSPTATSRRCSTRSTTTACRRRSACGHTVRNVMASEDAGVGLDEPFDCLPDARMVSDALIARSAVLNVSLPSRMNIALGGSPRCRHDALVNDIGLVSMVRRRRGRLRGLGRRQPRQGARRWPCCSCRSCPATTCVAAVEAVVDVYVAHGNLDEPAKGRLKFVIERLGADAFRAAWSSAFADARAARPPAGRRRSSCWPRPSTRQILAESPPGGWGAGVRPAARRRARHRSRSTSRSATSSATSWSCSAISPIVTPTAS